MKAKALALALACAAPGTIGATPPHALLHEVQQQLPTAWRAALPPVTVQWATLAPSHHGHARGSRVLLNRALQGQPEAARRALIHELAHVLDRSARGGLSRDRKLLALAGWPLAPLAGRAARSTHVHRVPDAYERVSPGEFVAVNLEAFVLDPRYACRRPLLARWFARRLAMPEPRCERTYPFVSPGMDAPVHHVDPARVAGVDLLLAESGSAPSSRFGHVMLRVVGCAPGRVVGPACRLDHAHHRVLSFRAFVGDVRISNWRGLSGGYPSRLFSLPLAQVVDEYTSGELRGLQAYPLRLSDAQLRDVLARAAQVHWSQEGRYRFVGNNCAVETWRLLHDVLPGLPRRGAITPMGLVRTLRRAGLLDPVAEEFESRANAFDTMLAALDGNPPRSAHAWFALPAAKRREYGGRAGLRAMAALLVLENAALQRQWARVQAQPARALRSDAQREAARLADNLTRPASWFTTGYGLPLPGEQAALERAAEALNAQWRQADSAHRAALRDSLPAAAAIELDATRDNIDWFGSRLRELAASP